MGRIAIIGTGISGLGAAYLLRKRHDVVIYEQNNYLGGHTRSITREHCGQEFTVDTGFIVFNDRNYPLLTKLFPQLDIASIESNMSFGVSVDQGWLEYSTNNPNSLFSQRRNLLRRPFWGMLREILRFNREAARFLHATPETTLRECLKELRMGEWFKQYYLLPMASSIWSTPLQSMLDFPASTFIRFFHNHGLLTVMDQPQWRTVLGGAKNYVEKIVTAIHAPVRLGGASQVRKSKNAIAGVEVVDALGMVERFDEVVLACHADEAIRLIEEPTPQQREVLTTFRYQENEVVLHCDEALMPRRKDAWASWVYLLDGREDNCSNVSLSYWMNNLQSLPVSFPVIVTMNPRRMPRQDLTLDRHTFMHPLFDSAAIRAQEQIPKIQGENNLWFCGAYQRYGFHEDGLWSAVRVAESLGGEAL